MTERQFNLWNKVCAAAAFVVSAITYLLTMEPTASFWDCGEFIASSYKLEVGHPPGNPVFQLIARFFTMFGDNMHAAVLVNAMSGICSALTILLLYLAIVWLAKRIVSNPVAILGSGLVGALAYCFSDTFWFSAVEGEVYAMSSLFTALVFWAMTRWYDCADEPHSLRWIVLIAFLMGLSIGVHLLNLLAIPALVFMFYFRRKPSYSIREHVGIFLLGVLILAVILFAIIPYLPKIAAYVDLFFVNNLHLPYNSGAIFFLLAVLGLCFWAIFYTIAKKKVLANTVMLCLTSIIVGFSIFSVDVIRSCAKTPTNEYQPDNAFTLVRYLSREQYGKTPLLYGQYYDAPYDLSSTKYWAPLPDRQGRDHYEHVNGPVDAKYRSEGKMLFPRMWTASPDGRYEAFYESYTGGRGRKIAGSKYRKPTMADNLAYFFDYQLGWMYWRYFMWNFVGRQNEIHSPVPGDVFHGNWESGIGFIDAIRLGDQSMAPDTLLENKGKNHYFFLPLLLGLLGLCFQFGKDKRGTWLTFLMFFMTGIAIVIYLNQPPYQVRERDYAYAGSFYFFCVWIGLGVAAIIDFIERKINRGGAALQIGAVTLCLLCVPVLMAAQNWDDHNRSGRRTAVELAYNYLNSVGQNGILITHGDNDTFPLWYAQEVEDVRTDVRICNTSLLGTDWHIDQMLYAVNQSAPLPLSVPHRQYLYGENEYVPVVAQGDAVMDLSDAMAIFRSQKEKVSLSSGRKVDYLPARKFRIPVNKRNAVQSGIISPADSLLAPSSIVISLPAGKDYVTKPELFMLDLLSNYDWTRPLHLLNQGGDLNMGIKDYLEYCGFSYRFTPFKNKISGFEIGRCNLDNLYHNMTEVYRWDALKADKWFIDYQNIYTFLGVMNIRQLFYTCALAFADKGQNDRALQMLDTCTEIMQRFPLETIPIGFSANDYIVVAMTSLYSKLGQKEKAAEIGAYLGAELLNTAAFYYQNYAYAQDDFENTVQYLYFLIDELKSNGNRDLASEISKRLDKMFGTGKEK